MNIPIAVAGILLLVMMALGIPMSISLLASGALAVVSSIGAGTDAVLQQLVYGLNSYVLLAVPLFILSGSLAANGETSTRLVNVMRLLLGRIPGGLGIATIFACAFFAAISGTTFATIVAIGTIMYPCLVEAGYDKKIALGMITAGGTLGILIPPSVPMVTLSVVMGASVSRQFMAGFVPGIGLALLWCIYVMFYSKHHEIKLEPKRTRQEKIKILVDGIPAILFPVIVLGGIYSGLTTPTEAAVISIVYVLVLEKFVFKSLDFRKLPGLAGNAVVTSGSLMFMIGCARIITWAVTVQKLPMMFADFINAAIPNQILFYVVLVVFLIICGCFLDVTPIVMIVGPILANTLMSFNVDFAQFGVICVLCCQIGNLTPPFGPCLFLSTNTFKRPFSEVVQGSIPFLIALVIFTFLCAFIPEISIFLPDMVGL